MTISPVTQYDLDEFVCFGYDVQGNKINGAIGKIQLTVRGRNVSHQEVWKGCLASGNMESLSCIRKYGEAIHLKHVIVL